MMRIDAEYWPGQHYTWSITLVVRHPKGGALKIYASLRNAVRKEWSATATDGQSNSIEYRSKNMVAIFRDRWN
jgi:hypothetical protein